MFIKIDRQKIISLGSSPARGISINRNGDLQLEVSWDIDTQNIINKNTTIAYLSILGDETSPASLSTADGPEAIKAIKTDYARRADKEGSTQRRILLTKNVDLTAYISNTLGGNKTGRSLQNASGVTGMKVSSVSTYEASQANLDLVVTTVKRSYTVPDETLSGYTRQLARQWLMSSGIPLTALAGVNNVIPSGHSLSGLAPRSGHHNPPGTLTSLATSLCEAAPKLQSQPENVGVLSQHSTTVATVTETLVIPSWMSADHYTLLVEIIDSSTSAVLDVAKISLRLSDVLRDARALRHNPDVKITSDRKYTTFSCASPDGHLVGGYLLLVKRWNPDTSRWVWTQSGSYPAVDGYARFQITGDSRSIGTYRVVALDSKNVITQRFHDTCPRSNYTSTATSPGTVGKIVEGGLQHTVINAPLGTLSVNFFIKDMTVNGSSEILVGSRMWSQSLSWIHSGLVEGHTYQITCSLLLKGGTTVLARPNLVKYVPLRNNIISTKVDNLAISNNPGGSSDVRFVATATLLDGNSDALLQLLNSSGITRYYDNDISAARENLKKLIRLYVVRHNLSNGDQEDLGAITTDTGEFVDSTATSLVGASSINPENQYLYEIRCYLRSPDTLLDDYRKTSTDKKSGRSYTWSPAKFGHPVVLTKGVITSTRGEKETYGLDKFKFYDSGSVTYVELNPILTTPSITTSSARLVGDREVSISWKLSGTTGQIDHYVVLIQQGDFTNVLGIAHGALDNSAEVRYSVAGYVGSHRFCIIPVLNDGSESAISTTNYVDIQ